VHVMELFEAHKVFLPKSKKSILMRSLQVCGNITIRGIYTSDIQYTIKVYP